jgi:hypothetical protein
MTDHNPKRRDSKYFDQKFTELRIKQFESMIVRERLLAEARHELEAGSFKTLVKAHRTKDRRR